MPGRSWGLRTLLFLRKLVELGGLAASIPSGWYCDGCVCCAYIDCELYWFIWPGPYWLGIAVWNQFLVALRVLTRNYNLILITNRINTGMHHISKCCLNSI